MTSSPPTSARTDTPTPVRMPSSPPALRSSGGGWSDNSSFGPMTTMTAAATASATATAMTLSAPPISMEQLVFRVKQVNAHTVFNRWTTVDETAHFALQTKEKRAITTSQCRIIVKGARHFPLQISDGPSIEFLFTTWQYIRQVEDVVPRDWPYKEVEKWVQLHVRELTDSQDAESVDACAQGGGRGDDAHEEEEDEEEGDSSAGSIPPNRGSPPLPTSPSPPSPPLGGPQALAAAGKDAPGSAREKGNGAMEQLLSFREACALVRSSLFLAARRPTTKEEWQRRHELIAMAKRNRTIAVMIFFTIYTLLMRYTSFDTFLLLLFFLQIFLFYVTTFYREIAVHFARRAAEKRVDRVKDWFYFGLRNNNERKSA